MQCNAAIDPTERVWGCQEETFNYPSLAALVAANRKYLRAGMAVFSGLPVPPTASDFVSADRVIEDLQSDASALFGECADDYGLNVPQEAVQGLQALLEAWLMENVGLPQCYCVRDVQRHTLTDADLSSE